MCFGEARAVVLFLRRFLNFRFTGSLARYLVNGWSDLNI